MIVGTSALRHLLVGCLAQHFFAPLIEAFSVKRTAEPFPSIVLQPTETSKLSIDAHSTVLGAGSAKMALSVFLCLPFMQAW